jgi:hypothetical protein
MTTTALHASLPVKRVIVAMGLLALAALPTLAAPDVPDWALPGSETHTQVPPPAGFKRESTSYDTPVGVFEGQTDVGTAVVPGNTSYDAPSGTYVINSAGYNIWYFRDEFRYLWKKMSGDVSLAATVAYPNPKGYDDRKVVLIIRQDLDDDSKEAMVALHGTGMIHLAQRAEKGIDITEALREAGEGAVGSKGVRIGIEKKGNAIRLYVALHSGHMRHIGKPIIVKFQEPFYVGIGFTSHIPNEVDTAVISKVNLVNAAGKVR